MLFKTSRNGNTARSSAHGEPEQGRAVWAATRRQVELGTPTKGLVTPGPESVLHRGSVALMGVRHAREIPSNPNRDFVSQSATMIEKNRHPMAGEVSFAAATQARALRARQSPARLEQCRKPSRAPRAGRGPTLVRADVGLSSARMAAHANRGLDRKQMRHDGFRDSWGFLVTPEAGTELVGCCGSFPQQSRHQP